MSKPLLSFDSTKPIRDMTTNDLVTRNAEAKKKKKYLDLYYEWAKEGEIPYFTTVTISGESSGGLCNIFLTDPLFKLCSPIPEELESAPICGFWGMDGEEFRFSTPFSDLRQNIVILMACLNNEL